MHNPLLVFFRVHLLSCSGAFASSLLQRMPPTRAGRGRLFGMPDDGPIASLPRELLLAATAPTLSRVENTVPVERQDLACYLCSETYKRAHEETVAWHQARHQTASLYVRPWVLERHGRRVVAEVLNDLLPPFGVCAKMEDLRRQAHLLLPKLFFGLYDATHSQDPFGFPYWIVESERYSMWCCCRLCFKDGAMALAFPPPPRWKSLPPHLPATLQDVDAQIAYHHGEARRRLVDTNVALRMCLKRAHGKGSIAKSRPLLGRRADVLDAVAAHMCAWPAARKEDRDQAKKMLPKWVNAMISDQLQGDA